MRVVCSLSIALCCVATAWSQAVVEHATVSAASSTSAAAPGVGKSISGVLGTLSKTSDKATKSSSASSEVKTPELPLAASKPTEVSAPPPARLVDPSQVTIGLDLEELIKRCGEPSLSLSQVRHSQLVEVFWYNRPHNEFLEVTVHDGKVTLVTRKLN